MILPWHFLNLRELLVLWTLVTDDMATDVSMDGGVLSQQALSSTLPALTLVC